MVSQFINAEIFELFFNYFHVFFHVVCPVSVNVWVFNSELLQFYFQPDTAVEWAQSRFGLRAGGAEDGRTPSADDELPSKEASTFHAAAANSNRRRWAVCSGLFSAAEWSVFGALFGATLPLETLRWCSESFCVHSIVQTSCQSSSEWSINQWPSGHPQLHQRFSFSRECVHMLSSVTVTASDWVSRVLLQKEVWPVIIKKGQGWTADGREVADHNSRRLLEPLLSGDFTWRRHKVRINC